MTKKKPQKKRPVSAVSCAVLVAKIATKEKQKSHRVSK